MKVIAILNQKGGSGKTTTAVNLSATLVAAGKKVLLIDLDPQSSASLWYGSKNKEAGLYDLFLSSQKLENIIEKTEIEGLHLVPASLALLGLEKALASDLTPEKILKNAIQRLPSHPWNYILIDCPPRLGILSLNALHAANEVLIPVETHVMALHGLVQLVKTINRMKEKYNPSLKIRGILPCRVDVRTKHSRDVLQQLRIRFGAMVFQTVIRENVKLAEAPLCTKPITLFAPQSKGAEDYQALAQEILKQEEPRLAV